jgi:accessory gene regulator protein AgrB
MVITVRKMRILNSDGSLIVKLLLGIILHKKVKLKIDLFVNWQKSALLMVLGIEISFLWWQCKIVGVNVV